MRHPARARTRGIAVLLWLLSFVVANAINVDPERLGSVVYQAGPKKLIVAVGDKTQKLQITVKVRDAGASGTVYVMPPSAKRMDKLAKKMDKDGARCGLMIDSTANGYEVTGLGTCDLEPPTGDSATPPVGDVPVEVVVSGEPTGTRTGWTHDPTRLLAASEARHGPKGTYVVDISTGSGSALSQTLARASGLNFLVRQEKSARDALALTARGTSKEDHACGVALERHSDQPLWRVYTVGDCPRGQLQDEVDLRIEAASGEERARLEAEDAAYMRQLEAAELARRQMHAAAVPYVVPTAVKVGGEVASVHFAGLELRGQGGAYDVTGLIQRKIANRILLGAGYETVDSPDDARFILLGSVVEAGPWDAGPWDGFALGVDWQLYDTEAERWVYAVRTRAWLSNAYRGTGLQAAEELLARALLHLLARDGFVARAQKATAGTLPESPWNTPISMTRCQAGGRTMPGAAEKVTAATLAVSVGDSVGSAVQISPDGWALTAFHVVGLSEAVGVQRPDGSETTARVVRADPALDVALLHLADDASTCLPIGKAPTVGTSVWAIGSPTGLNFSVSGGMVSAQRTTMGTTEIQTDAAVSPGNSGGALVGPSGRLLGVVVSKRVGDGVEGLGFATPAADALEAMDATFGSTSSDADKLVEEWKGGENLAIDRPDPMPGADFR